MDQKIFDIFSSPRETVLDRRGYVEGEIVLDLPAVSPLCEMLPNLRPRKIDIGGVRLYCEEQGNGIPLVLVHGGPGHSHHGFHPSFSRLGDAPHVIYYDQRGCWRSDYIPDTGYCVTQSVDDLEALRKALGISQWVVLGHSYGGLLAQCYAATYPDALRGLVIVNSIIAAPATLEPSRLAEFLSAEEQAAQETIFPRTDLTPAQFMYNLQLNGRWKRANYYRPTLETLSRISRYEWTHDEGYYNAIAESMMEWINRGPFDLRAIPTLLMESKWDITWNSVDKPAKIHQTLPHARLELFEHSSHSPFNDEPDRFFALLEEFLTDLQSGR